MSRVIERFTRGCGGGGGADEEEEEEEEDEVTTADAEAEPEERGRTRRTSDWTVRGAPEDEPELAGKDEPELVGTLDPEVDDEVEAKVAFHTLRTSSSLRVPTSEFICRSSSMEG